MKNRHCSRMSPVGAPSDLLEEAHKLAVVAGSFAETPAIERARRKLVRPSCLGDALLGRAGLSCPVRRSTVPPGVPSCIGSASELLYVSWRRLGRRGNSPRRPLPLRVSESRKITVDADVQPDRMRQDPGFIGLPDASVPVEPLTPRGVEEEFAVVGALEVQGDGVVRYARPSLRRLHRRYSAGQIGMGGSSAFGREGSTGRA